MPTPTCPHPPSSSTKGEGSQHGNGAHTHTPSQRSRPRLHRETRAVPHEERSPSSLANSTASEAVTRHPAMSPETTRAAGAGQRGAGDLQTQTGAVGPTLGTRACPTPACGSATEGEARTHCTTRPNTESPGPGVSVERALHRACLARETISPKATGRVVSGGRSARRVARETAAPLRVPVPSPAGEGGAGRQGRAASAALGGRGAALSSERGGSQWAKLHAHHHWAGNREGTPGEKAPVRNSGWQRDFGGIMILSNQL